MAEQQSTHRMALEKHVVTGDSRRSYLGLILTGPMVWTGSCGWSMNGLRHPAFADLINPGIQTEALPGFLIA